MMDYSDDWVHPARTVKQARCKLGACTQDGVPASLVMECTLNADGWCTSCARSADSTHQELPMEA